MNSAESKKVAPVLRPTRPSAVMRIRSAKVGPVLATMAPDDRSAKSPAAARISRAPALVSKGVVTEVVALRVLVPMPPFAVNNFVSVVVPSTRRSPPMSALPSTVSRPPAAVSSPTTPTVPLNWAALATASVPLRSVAPSTRTASRKRVAPVTSRLPPRTLLPATRKLPLTSSSAVGVAVPMPTKPASAPVPPRMRIRSMSFVRMTSGAASSVPTNSFSGLVPTLPPRTHAFAENRALVATWDSTPSLPVITTRSRPVRLVLGLVPPKDVSVVAPVTPRVPKLPLPVTAIVLALMPAVAVRRPFTVAASAKVAAFATASLPLRSVAPFTVSAPSRMLASRTRNEPFTSRRAVGAPIPMPTSPAGVMSRRSSPAVRATSVPEAPVAESCKVPALLTDGVTTPPLALRTSATVRAPSTLALPRARSEPATSSSAVGVAVPMPTKPASAPVPPRMRIRSLSLVRMTSG